MHAIDSQLLLRLVARDNPRQAAAADIFVEPGAWVSLLTLTETIGVLASVYGRSAAELSVALEMLLAHRSLTIQDSDVVTEALGLFRSRPALAFSDCLILQVARKTGHLPLGTFNVAFAGLEGALKLL